MKVVNVNGPAPLFPAPGLLRVLSLPINMILEFAGHGGYRLTFYIPALQIKCIGLYILLAIRSCVVRGFEDIQDICLISRM